MHDPLHPGEVVREALFDETDIRTVVEASERLGVDRTTLSHLLNGHMGISAEMAYRLSLLLSNTGPEMWLSIQKDYELWQAKSKVKKMRIKPLKLPKRKAA